MTPGPSIIDACNDPKLFGPWFKDRTSWAAWFAFLSALFGLSMSAGDLALFQQCTGRDTPLAGTFRECWLVCGRRAGKSFILALIAVFLAVFKDWRPYLTPGERGTVVVIAADKKQARAIYRYAHALLTQIPLIKPLVVRETAEAIDLDNQTTIEILTANFRTVRGYTLVAALCDEIAFWHSEDSANPDTEVIAAIRPAMATIPRAMLLCASSPYARRGALWNAYRQHYGKESPVLVWKSDTRTMNPTVPQSVIDEAMEADPASARAEYGAEFRADVETFVSREVVDTAVIPGRFELPPASSIHYVGFADAAGGSGGDSFTAAVAHLDRVSNKIILDAVREQRPPFSPEATIKEHSAFFHTYGVRRITADRWGGEFPVEQFRKHGIACEVSEQVKSDIYKELLPLLNSGKVELLDNQRLITQLLGLERRTARSGKDSIDHAPGAHDDVCNSAAGALVATAQVPVAMQIPTALMDRLRTERARREVALS